MTEHSVPLGTTGLYISPIGLGCWQFSGGKGIAGRYWRGLSDAETQEIVQVSLDHGISWFDTAESYGWGTSEESLSKALRACNVSSGDVLVADKWFPFLRFAGSIEKSFRSREEHLQPYPIHLYQIHFPASFSSIEKQMERMLRLVKEQRVEAIGVSNFSAEQMYRANRRLADEGITVASNQVRYNLLDRDIETNGVLDAADELGATIIAYSPLSQGLLTGKYHNNQEAIQNLSAPRKWMKPFKPDGLARTKPLISAMEEIAETHSAAVAEVALAWIIRRHGERIVAIPGASSAAQAQSNAESMGLHLTSSEIERLDTISREVASR